MYLVFLLNETLLESNPNWNVNPSSSNTNYKDMTNEKNKDRKTEISIQNVSFDKRNDSGLVEELTNNVGGWSLIISDQVLNEIFIKTAKIYFSFLSDIICEGINIKNLNSRLCIASCRFSSLVVLYQNISTVIFVQLYLYIAALHMRTNGIMNSEVNKDLVPKSIINIAKDIASNFLKDLTIT